MICARCDQPILPGQKTRTYPVDGASGAGTTVVVHEWLCRKQPTQTYPSR